MLRRSLILMDNNNPVQKAVILSQESFHEGPGQESVVMNLFWGVRALDRSHVSMWDDEYRGELHWDPEFSLSDYQQEFIDICSRAKTEEKVLAV